MLTFKGLVHWNLSAQRELYRGSRYPEKYQKGLDFTDNETPYIPDRICLVNETPLYVQGIYLVVTFLAGEERFGALLWAVERLFQLLEPVHEVGHLFDDGSVDLKRHLGKKNQILRNLVNHFFFSGD